MSDACITAEQLELILGGHVFFQTLRTAVELDLFTAISRTPGISLSALGLELGVEAYPLRIVLLGCLALRLIERRGDGLHNSSVANEYLNRDSAENIIPAVEFAHKVVYRGMYHMAESVKQNKNLGLCEFPGTEGTLYERLSHDPALEELLHEGLQSTTRANVNLLMQHFDFCRVHNILDVGGGNGTAINAIAKRYSHLRGTILESQSVSALARQYIANEGMSERIDIRPGSGFTDPFPKTADCILFMHFMTIWSEKKNRDLLAKCYDALPRGGFVLIYDGAQRNDYTGPIRAARWSPYFLVLSSGEGMFYSMDEYAGWVEKAGFVEIQQITVSLDHILVVGRKP